MSKPIIHLDHFEAGKTEVCYQCEAHGQTYVGTVPIPLCKLARLEDDLGKVPTYGQASQEGIDATSIPQECPNGYLGSTSREIR